MSTFFLIHAPRTVLGLLFLVSAIDGFWAGPIDEVRVFSTVRTPAQVWADMHTHRLGPTAGLVGEWTFDEGSGQTSADSSGLGHTATLGTSAGDTVRDPAWVAR